MPLEAGAAGRLWYARTIKEVEGSFGITVPGALVGLQYFDVAESANRRGGKVEEVKVEDVKVVEYPAHEANKGGS